MSSNTIGHDAALNLKSASLALAEADQNLRAAGDTVDGVVEAAAAEYLERQAAFAAAVEAATSEYDGDPAAAVDAEEPEEVAEKPAERAAGESDSKDEKAEPKSTGGKAKS